MVPRSGFRVHPEYASDLIRNDIATVISQTSITYNAHMHPVALPSGPQINEDFAGITGTVSGWGRFSDDVPTASPVLRFVHLPIITNTACRIRFPFIIQDNNICASGEGGRSGMRF